MIYLKENMQPDWEADRGKKSRLHFKNGLYYSLQCIVMIMMIVMSIVVTLI